MQKIVTTVALVTTEYYVREEYVDVLLDEPCKGAETKKPIASKTHGPYPTKYFARKQLNKIVNGENCLPWWKKHNFENSKWKLQSDKNSYRVYEMDFEADVWIYTKVKTKVLSKETQRV